MRRPFLAGAVLGASLTPLLRQGLLIKFRGDIAKLNAGDYAPLLAAYAEDGVIRFNPGEHRWSGTHRGKPALERFFRDFVGAGVQGELVDVWVKGPPWALRVVARFDDGVVTADGERLYANRTALELHLRWARVVYQEDFYEDTGRILDLERALVERGQMPVAA